MADPVFIKTVFSFNFWHETVDPFDDFSEKSNRSILCLMLVRYINCISIDQL